MTQWRGVAALIWLPAACAQSDAVKIEIYSLAPRVIQARLELVTQNIVDRRARLEALFREVGCDGEYLTEKPIPHLKDANLVWVLPGTSSTRIVVGGHYDLVTKGIGAVDDWSGAVMLPSLYQSLKSKPRSDTFVFIAFAGEEGGLLGSRAYVKQLSAEERTLIHAMVNLECLGTSPPKVWASRADKRLLAFYAHLAPGMGIKAEASNVDRLGDDDSHPFLDAKIPVITIHSITQDTIRILHSAADNLKAIHAADYYDAYRLSANYLALLDQAVD